MDKKKINNLIIDFKFNLIHDNHLSYMYKLLIIKNSINSYYKEYLKRIEKTIKEEKKQSLNKELKNFVNDKYIDISNILEYNPLKINNNYAFDVFKFDIGYKYIIFIIHCSYSPYYGSDYSPQEEILKDVEEWKLITYKNMYKN